MKTTILTKSLFNGCAFILLLTIVCSCSNAYFDQPQPVNARNLKKIPKELRGIWTGKNGSQICDSIIIDKTSYRHIEHYDDIIPKTQMDTSREYLIIKDKIHYKDKDQDDTYKNGFDYIFKNDTFFMKGRYIINYFCLSDSVILRKAKETYVCNIKKGNWWELYLIQKMKNGEIKISYPEGKELKENQKKYGINLIDSVPFRSDFKLCFHATLNADFFVKNKNDNVFSLYYTLSPNSTFIANH